MRRSRILRFVRLLTVAAVLLVALACNRLTQDNFAKIEDGMTLDQVVAVLGEPTDSKSAGVGPLSATDATWENDSARINIKFLNGKVQLKAYESKEKGSE